MVGPCRLAFDNLNKEQVVALEKLRKNVSASGKLRSMIPEGCTVFIQEYTTNQKIKFAKIPSPGTAPIPALLPDVSSKTPVKDLFIYLNDGTSINDTFFNEIVSVANNDK